MIATDCSGAANTWEPSCPAGDKKPRPWLQQLAALPPAAQAHPREAAPGHRRKRPYIYVYDMPPAYTGRMLQVGGAT